MFLNFFHGLLLQIHQLSGFEFSNLTLLVGVIVATYVLRTTGYSPGGILAPAFMVLAIVSSIWWALLLPIIGMVVAVMYKQFFSKIYMGRQPLFIMAAMSVAIMSIIGTIFQHFEILPVSEINYPLGIILPAILASSITKQGAKQTYNYLSLAIAITVVIIATIYSIGLAAGHDFHALDRLIADRETLHIGWGAILSLLSIGIGYVIYRIRNVKSAGYIMLPFLATLFVVSFANFVIVICLSVIAYALTSLMRRYSLMLGVGRYSFVLAVAVVMVWTTEYILLTRTTTFSPFMGTSIFASLAIAVLVNEHTIYGVRKAAPLLALSLSIMICIELGGAYTVQALSHQSATIRSLTVHTRLHNIPTIPQVLGGK